MDTARDIAHMGPTPGEWWFCIDYREPCRVLDAQDLWGSTALRVWIPSLDTVVRIQAARLAPLAEAHIKTPAYLTYIAAAARVADALTQDVLLAPIESSVIPLPHQIRALSRVMTHDRIRYLLADEVGLGKTIEAGLILRELKLRGLARRVLVIAPKGLVSQWISEMRTHFNEEFQLVLPDDLASLRRMTPTADSGETPANPDGKADTRNPWRMFRQVVCPMDSVKPMDGRRGWSRQEVAEYNRERFEDLVTAGWDLVIVDEAHRLGGSTEQVARYRLGQGLAEAAPYLLLLSATPHQGKTDAFHRIIALLDNEAFPDTESVTQQRVHPYVIRTEKRRAIDAHGKPLFKPRQTRLVPVLWADRHRQQRLLYEAVTEYVRQGYNQAMQEKKTYIGFLMILMQRLVTSSTRAIRTTLERRLEALRAPDEQLTLFPMLPDDEWRDLDGQEQIETLLKTRLAAMKNERAEVELLLETTRRIEAAGADAKAEALLEWVYRLQQEEGDPDLKVLIFTEFVPTQQMLRDFLAERGFSVVCLNGSMDMDERRKVQDAFANSVRVLVSTDAGGEGLNLQFCHVVVNYDIPWNPMRLEQRIGRVDRIGQACVVRALNLVFEETVEYRVREVLEEKLAVILDEFGVDKTGDVLDSAQAGEIFDDLYIEAILNPDSVNAVVDSVVDQVRKQAEAAKESASVLSAGEALNPTEAQRLMAHPLPHWVERMTVSYLEAHGGRAERRGHVWNLTWPDGAEMQRVVFTSRDLEAAPSARYLSLEDPRVRGLALHLGRFAPGQPISRIHMPGLPVDVKGAWSLWRVAIHAVEWSRQRIMALFVHDDRRVLMPTARYIWDQLLAAPPIPQPGVDGPDASRLFEAVKTVAVAQGRTAYDELVQMHRKRLLRELEKGEYALASRRRVIEHIGLPTVRSHRLAQLAEEERTWREHLVRQEQVNPELVPLLLIRVEGGGENV